MSRSLRVVVGVAGLLLALVAASFALHGWSEEALRACVRASARVSVVLLWLAFTASALHALAPGRATRGLVRSRRGIGLAFALSQAVHLVALALLGIAFPDPFVAGLGAVTVVGGGFAYALTAAMALTSSDRAVRALGARRWKLLHRIGVYYIWLIFLQSYLGRAAKSPAAALTALLLLLALALRIASWQRGRRRASARVAEAV